MMMMHQYAHPPRNQKWRIVMRLYNAFVAMAAIGIAALSVSAADARSRHMSQPYGAHYAYGSSYSYGAERANPSLSPQGFEAGNPRDQQLQGHN